jgi:outer membrane protein assembly factor BamD
MIAPTKGASMRNSRIHSNATGALLRNWAAAVALLLVVSGCSSLPSFFGPSEPPPNANAEMLYKEGLDYLARKRYVNAIDRFQRVKADYPFAQEVLMAELKLGEAYYLNEQYPEAIEALKEFVAAHASSEHVSYALYTVGMAHFNQYTGSDRDQKLTELARGYFEKVARDFPKSPYAPQAREKLAKSLEYLAEHEFIVASFYINEKKYPAAQDRLEDILRKYKETSVAPKALYNLGESYRLDKNNVKAGLAYEALLHYYPSHPLAKTAQSQLSQLAKEKQDPLAALLTRQRRSGPAVAAGSGQPAAPGAEAPAEASKPKDLNLVAKTEVVNEDPGAQRSFLSRLNPFSSSPPPPEKAEAKKEEAKPQPAAKKAEPEKSGGFFSSLWRGINPFSSKAEAKPTATGDPQIVGDIDQSLKTRGTAQGAKPSAPKTELPAVPEAAPPPDAQAILGSLDATLGKKGVSVANLPLPPETSSALKTTDAERAAERSRPASGPAPDSGFVSKLDEALKQRGIDPSKIEAVRAQKPPTTGAPPLVARPKPEPQIQLEPRLGTERKGPLLGAQEFQPQERPAPLKEADLAPGAEAASPAPPAEPEQPQSLPQAVVTGPPQPPKEKPAETKSAAKAGAEPEEKGVLDQLKEDAGRIGNILNPFKW